jgi:predicted RND superfamily exporter protein
MDLLKSLAGTFFIVSVLVLIMFRSWRLGLLLLVPNVAPLAVIALILVLTGGRLQVATMVVFSICLGIVVDDSIHLLTRFQQHRRSGLSAETACALSLSEVGGVLIQTTVIICAGFSVLLFSNTPPVNTIGLLCVSAIPVALLFDLGMLPPLIRRFSK